jgi:hypothetical protein
MFKPGRAVVPSNGVGTAPDAATTPGGVEISFDVGVNREQRQLTTQVLVTNREAAAGNLLEISFSNGRDGTFFAIPPQMTITFDVQTHRVSLRGASGGTAAYSIMAIVS